MIIECFILLLIILEQSGIITGKKVSSPMFWKKKTDRPIFKRSILQIYKIRISKNINFLSNDDSGPI